MPFELKAKIGLDSSSLIAGLEQGKAAVRGFGSSMKSHMGSELAALKGQFAAAFGVGALTAGISSLIKMGGEISDLSAKTEISAHDVQALGYAAKQTGASFDEMAQAMKKIAVAREDALSGKGSAKIDFQRLGVSIDDLRNKKPHELFLQISQTIQKAGNSTDYLTSLLGVMGKNSDNLIPAMKQGVGGLVGEFDRLGLAINDQTIKRLDEMGDAWDRTMLRVKKHSAEGFVGTVDAIKGQVEALGNVIGGIFNPGAAIGGMLNQAFQGQLDQTEKKASNWIDRLLAKGKNAQGMDGITDVPKRVDEAKKKLTSSFDHQFDSLARIGGSMQVENRRMPELGQQILKTLQSMEAIMKAGGFGQSDTDSVTSFL